MLVGWIGAMAVLALVLIFAVWCGGEPGEEPPADPEALEEQLQPVDGETEAGETGETGEEVAAGVDEEAAETGAPSTAEPAGEKPDGPGDAAASKPDPEKKTAAATEAPDEPPVEEPPRPQPTEVKPEPKKPDPEPEPPRVTREEVAAVLEAARAARQAAETAGAPDLAHDLWQQAVGKLDEGKRHRPDRRLDLEQQAYAEAEALFVRAAGEATAEKERLEAESGRSELPALVAEFERGLATGTEAGFDSAATALARVREIDPEDGRLTGLTDRLEDARKRFWQSHGITRNFTIAPGVEMEFVWVPPGTFRMGTVSKKHSARERSDESPKHTVVIGTGFWMGKYEVTQEQWQAVMGDNPARFKGPRRPVNRISWNDAKAFVEKLNATAGAGRFRLPTEAEWEFVCRAGTSRSFFGGEINTMGCENEDHLAPWAWYCYNSNDSTQPVGQKRPNAWGFHDMHGNVLEWCADYYGRSYYAESPTRDPQGPASGKTRILRGGGWDSRAWNCRSASRKYSGPKVRDNSHGFRVVRVAD
jgi:formylglycine-generating enzyme required for sulfatase activity